MAETHLCHFVLFVVKQIPCLDSLLARFRRERG